MGKDFKWIYETIDFEYRNVKDRIKGRYVPILKFGGTKKYVNRNDKNDDDQLNNITCIKDGWSCSDRKARLDGEYGINRVRFSPEGKYVAACSTNGIVFLYDLFENKLLSKIITEIDNISDITISDDERYIYACGNNCLIEIFDIRENKSRFNNSVSKYVDASIYSILNHQENINYSPSLEMHNSIGEANKLSNHDIIHSTVVNNMYFPYKTKYRNPSTNKLVYVPIFNYSDMLKNKSNIVDVADIYINKVNEYVTESVYSIPNSHLLSTTCLAVQQRKNYLVYSGGSDGLIKIWDTRNNSFEGDELREKSLESGDINNGDKNPYVSFCCHEGVITSVCFNNTLDYEKMAYLEREEMMMKKKKRKKMATLKKYGFAYVKKKDRGKSKNVPQCNEKDGSDGFNDSDTSDSSESEYEEYEDTCCEKKRSLEECDIDLDLTDSDASSKFSYSSIEFNLTKKKYNDYYMTSSYDGYVRVYDLDNNVLKTYRHENKNVTHTMFSYNNKFIISTTQSKYAQVVDFLYMNNKVALRDMENYLETYQKYILNDYEEIKRKKMKNEKEDKKQEPGEEKENNENEKEHKAEEEEEEEAEEEKIRMVDIFKIKEDPKRHFVPFQIKNIMKDKEMHDEIKLVNEFNAIRNKKYRRRALRAGLNHILCDEPIVRLDRKNFFQNMEINSDSSAYDEVTRRKKHYYDRINKHFSPLWLYFVDDHHHMNLIPYNDLAESLKGNHIYMKDYYANMRNRDPTSSNKNTSSKEQKSVKEESLYKKMSKALRCGFSFPKFYSCVAGDKCLIPSVDTYVHVYDIITGLHVNTIHNLYAPNYCINYSQFFNDKYRNAVQKKVSFITSVDAYPKNQNIIATSNGYPDGSIVIWVYTPF